MANTLTCVYLWFYNRLAFNFWQFKVKLIHVLALLHSLYLVNPLHTRLFQLVLVK